MTRILLVFLLLSALPAAAHDPEGSDARPSMEVSVEAAPGRLPDADVVDQFGNHLRFREAVGDGAYVLGFTYTNCTSLCGMAELWLSHFAERRGEIDGPVRLVTLTLDPARDRPADLLRRHRELGSHEGWLRLTGRPSEIIPLLTRLGAWDGRPIEEHKLVILVGNAGEEVVTRLEPDPMLPERLFALASAYAR